MSEQNRVTLDGIEYRVSEEKLREVAAAVANARSSELVAELALTDADGREVTVRFDGRTGVASGFDLGGGGPRPTEISG